MADAEFTVKFTDKVSGPAAAAQRAVQKFGKSISRLKAGLPAVQSGFERNRGAMSDWRTQAVFAAKAARRLRDAQRGAIAPTTGLTSGGVALGNVLAMIAQGAVRAAAAIARFAAQAALAFGATLGKALLFGESIQFSLTRFLGSGSVAQREIAAVLKLSNRLGLDFQTAAENFKDFISAGFTVETSKELLGLKADLLAVGTGTEESKQKIETAFEHIQRSAAMGRMEMDRFAEILGNLPVEKADIFAKLAPKMGKTVEELMKMDMTKMPVKKLIEAITEATLEKNKATVAGETAARKQLETTAGAWNALKAVALNMFDVLAKKLGPVLGDTVLPMLQDMLTALRGPEAGTVIDSIAQSFKAMAGAIGRAWEQMGGAEGLRKNLDKLATTITNITTLIGKFSEGFGVMSPHLKEMPSALSSDLMPKT
jgi:hypothetical protein